MNYRADQKDLALADYLAAHSGIRGLALLGADELDRVRTHFERDGFVVIRDALNDEQLECLRAGVNEAVQEITALDPEGKGNRGRGRYSFGGSSLTRSQLHRPAWQMLLSVEPMLAVLDVLFGSPDYVLRAASGDFCMPGTKDYQRLHSDVRDWSIRLPHPSVLFMTQRAKRACEICRALTYASIFYLRRYTR